MTSRMWMTCMMCESLKVSICCFSTGKGVYLGTILTTAPLETLQVAMHEAGLNEAYLAQFLANGSGNNTTFGDSHMKIVNQSSRPADHGKAIQRPQDRTRRKGLVLNIEELTIISGDNQPLLDQFNLRMLTEETVIIEGDTGVGKTTLLRAICGLWPCTASWISMTNKVSVSVEIWHQATESILIYG